MLEHVVCVDPAVAGDHRLGDTVGADEILRPNAVGQTVRRSIHEIKSFLFRVEAHEVRDWTKDFVSRAYVLGRPCQQTGLNVKSPFLRRPLRLLALQQYLGTFACSLLEIPEHTIFLLRADDGAHFGFWGHSVPDAHFLQSCYG